MISIRIPPLPSDTARASATAFGKDHPYLKIGDRLNTVLSGIDLEKMVVSDASLANTFWPYSFATILQYWEELTDRQMANATRTRIDLKYALHLPLIYPGIDPLALCRFRQRLLVTKAGRIVFDQVGHRLDELVVNRLKPLADSEVIISTICKISQCELVITTMSNTVEALAASHPEWLRAIALPHWFKRYAYRESQGRSSSMSGDVQACIQAVGEDGQYLLAAIERSKNSDLMRLPEVRLLCSEWQHFFVTENDQLRLRSQSCAHCASQF